MTGKSEQKQKIYIYLVPVSGASDIKIYRYNFINDMKSNNA